jgi:hypothetical protein
MTIRAAICCVGGALLLVMACRGREEGACVSVPAVAAELNVGQAWAVPVEVERAPGLRETGVVWFISTSDRATWATNRDLHGEGGGQLMLPLNDRARDAADVGREVPVNDPVFGGITDVHPAAAQSRECAARRR